MALASWRLLRLLSPMYSLPAVSFRVTLLTSNLAALWATIFRMAEACPSVSMVP